MQAVRDAGTLPGRLPLFLFSFFYYNLSRAELQAFLRTLPAGKIGAASRSLTRPRPARKRGRGAFAADRRSSHAGCVANHRRGAMQRYCSCRGIVSPRPLGNRNRCRGIVSSWLLGNGNRRRDSRQRFYICPEVQPGRLGVRPTGQARKALKSGEVANTPPLMRFSEISFAQGRTPQHLCSILDVLRRVRRRALAVSAYPPGVCVHVKRNQHPVMRRFAQDFL